MEKIKGNRLNQVYFKMDKNLDEIVDRCADIIHDARKEIYVMIDNPLPDFITYENNSLITALQEKIYEVPVKILARRHSNDREELRQFFPDLLDIRYLFDEQLDVEKLGEKAGTLQHDYFLIGDKNIFLGKPGYNEGVFTYNAPHLTELDQYLRNYPTPF